MKPTHPNIFEYTDFRAYLKGYYEAMKESTPFFSFRYFAKMPGFTSPNFYKLVMDGQRNLSAEGVQKFTKALKLAPKEARHFRLLVLLGQADTAEEKEYYTRQLFKSKVYKTLKPLTEAQYDYYSKWFYIPLRELVGRADFKNDPSWVAKQFTPALSETEVKQGLETLLKLELIEATPEGSFRQTNKMVSTGDEVASQAVANYHRHMIHMGAAAIDQFASAERDISSLTMGVSQATAKKIKEMIQDFRKEVMAVVSHDNTVEDVVQLNFQFFPLAKKGEE